MLRGPKVSHLKKYIQFSPPPPPLTPISQDKVLLNLWNKHFVRMIYRNTQIFAFKVLQECSSWGSRNGEYKCFFLTLSWNMFAGKLVKKWKSFLAVFWEHIIFNVKWVEVRNMSEVFWAKLYCKMSDLFC